MKIIAGDIAIEALEYKNYKKQFLSYVESVVK